MDYQHSIVKAYALLCELNGYLGGRSKKQCVSDKQKENFDEYAARCKQVSRELASVLNGLDEEGLRGEAQSQGS